MEVSLSCESEGRVIANNLSKLEVIVGVREFQVGVGFKTQSLLDMELVGDIVAQDLEVLDFNNHI